MDTSVSIYIWFQLVDPYAWCNTDHTSIHCKWTSIPVINTSRLSSPCFSSLALSISLSFSQWHRSANTLSNPFPLSLTLSLSLSLSLPRAWLQHTSFSITSTGILAASDLHVSDTRVGGYSIDGSSDERFAKSERYVKCRCGEIFLL